MPSRGRRLDCYDAGTFCPPAQRYMSPAEAAVPTPIKRQREVRLPGIKLTDNAQTVAWRMADSQSARWRLLTHVHLQIGLLAYNGARNLRPLPAALYDLQSAPREDKQWEGYREKASRQV